MYSYPHTALCQSGLFGDQEVEAIFGEAATLQRMLEFELALTESLGEAGLVAAQSLYRIRAALNNFSADPDMLAAAAARDGVVVPGLVRQLKSSLDERDRNSLHFGATSQDLVDTVLMLAIRDFLAIATPRLSATIGELHKLKTEFGPAELMGMTRMQPAQPIRVAKRIASWTGPLERHLKRLPELEDFMSVLQLGGPVGDRSPLGDHAGTVAGKLAKRLGLSDPGSGWHAERDRIAEIASWLALVTGSLGKIGQDLAIMAQQGVVKFHGGGKSSSMPHKNNPISAEILVTLARLNAVLVSGLCQSQLHEQERSGSAWMLEWILLPQMCVTTGASLSRAASVMRDIRSIG